MPQKLREKTEKKKKKGAQPSTKKRSINFLLLKNANYFFFLKILPRPFFFAPIYFCKNPLMKNPPDSNTPQKNIQKEGPPPLFKTPKYPSHKKGRPKLGGGC